MLLLLLFPVGETGVSWVTFSQISPKIFTYRFRIDTTRKGNPSSTNIINKLCCHFIR